MKIIFFLILSQCANMNEFWCVFKRDVEILCFNGGIKKTSLLNKLCNLELYDNSSPEIQVYKNPCFSVLESVYAINSGSHGIDNILAKCDCIFFEVES